jgi:hypothetical protein
LTFLADREATRTLTHARIAIAEANERRDSRYGLSTIGRRYGGGSRSNVRHVWAGTVTAGANCCSVAPDTLASVRRERE